MLTFIYLEIFGITEIYILKVALMCNRQLPLVLNSDTTYAHCFLLLHFFAKFVWREPRIFLVIFITRTNAISKNTKIEPGKVR